MIQQEVDPQVRDLVAAQQLAPLELPAAGRQDVQGRVRELLGRVNDQGGQVRGVWEQVGQELVREDVVQLGKVQSPDQETIVGVEERL